MQSVGGVKRLIALYYGKMFDKIHCYNLHRKAEFLMFLQQVTQTYACFWVKVLEKAPPPSTPIPASQPTYTQVPTAMVRANGEWTDKTPVKHSEDLAPNEAKTIFFHGAFSLGVHVFISPLSSFFTNIF